MRPWFERAVAVRPGPGERPGGLVAAGGGSPEGTWTRDPLSGRGPRTAVLAAGVPVVFAAAGAGAAAYGGSVHERDRAAEAAACSAADLALLAEVVAPGVDPPPAGEADGGCSVVVSSVPDAALAEAQVVAALERVGWQRARDGDRQVYEREGAVLRLSVMTDGKACDVRLTLR